MAILGIDDTDSRTEGMCTTWIASEVAERLRATIDNAFLVRLNPAVEHKTRGNGAVAIRAQCDLKHAFRVAEDVIDEFAIAEDPQTNPGLVGVDRHERITAPLRSFARRAVRSIHTRAEAAALLDRQGLHARAWGNGRGIIGAAAAVGAVGCALRDDPSDRVLGDWTYEYLAYREESRWGTDREIDVGPAITSLERWNGIVWDTIDPETGREVCAPHSPCPVLFGIRGDDPRGVRAVGQAIAGEPRDRGRLFLTNQGTDAHLRAGEVGNLREGRSYRVSGTVRSSADSRRGGHVAVEIGDDEAALECLAFAPTGRFRDRVRGLVRRDRVIVCGEIARGALKLEKFALAGRHLTEASTPTCPGCDRTMKSAGREQGYRCRACGTDAPGKLVTARPRELAPGWYEVPPGARRHLAKPLVRGTYDLPIHPTTT